MRCIVCEEAPAVMPDGSHPRFCSRECEAEHDAACWDLEWERIVDANLYAREEM